MRHRPLLSSSLFECKTKVTNSKMTEKKEISRTEIKQGHFQLDLLKQDSIRFLYKLRLAAKVS